MPNCLPSSTSLPSRRSPSIRRSPMTAHPKLDAETGEMLFFGYSPFPPYLQYHVADRSGALVRSEPIDVGDYVAEQRGAAKHAPWRAAKA